MKGYSLRRRLIATVLLLECALVAGLCAATLVFTWREQVHAFDLMIRGRADSLLGAVRDAEDPGDNVTVSPDALDLHAGDLWMVQDAGGRVLAHSQPWLPGAERDLAAGQKLHNFEVNGRSFRGFVLRGVRQIDAEGNNPGLARPVAIFYAASLRPVYEALERAGRFLLLASLLLLAITAWVLTLLLRRGLSPLEQLSLAAGKINPRQRRFQAPETARASSELAVLANALESATQRLEEAFQQQQVFVHDAAHELKTAVTIVKSSLQLLASRPRTTREYASGLQTCLGDCARMEDLVQRMLQLARFEQATSDREASCNLAEVVREVTVQIETLAEIRQVGVALEVPAAVTVLLSEEAAGSLLANLLLNAVQHTPPGGLVSASLTVSNEAELQVRDTGSGIAPEDLPHLFERFWRGDRSRTRSTGGAGLGLSICKAIADSCGGEISVSSQPGKGTCVTVRLPLPEQDHPREQDLPARQPAVH
jgi:signal transduction histidine kinase